MFVRRLVVSVVLLFSCAVALGQFAGQNINMVSGTNWPAGDPFLQRQNEPSMAVSSRNPEHLMAGANDYRTVDIANPLAPTILGDAWLGVYTSLDGGETWKSTLLPGYPQDTSSAGTASALHNTYTVATDPTVRAGTHGLFYYSGLVFNRGTNSASAVFVATFQDQNNKGNGDNALLVTDSTGTHGNPFLYINAKLVHTANTRQFLDKPWIAVDIPRPGRTATCKINGQTFQSGYVYVFYTVFTNQGLPTQHSSIMEVRSTNCGASWSAPLKLNDDTRQNQGASAVIDPQTGAVFVTWRALAFKTMPDSIQYAWSPDGWNWGNGISDGLVYTFPAATTTGGAFDQNQSGNTFRTTDLPTAAIDGSSKIWVAFTQRVPGPGSTSGSRIVLTTQSFPMWTWSTPYVADATSWANGAATVPGFQFMPSLAFAYGKLSLAWFDSRRDNLESVLSCPAGNTCTGLSQLTKVDQPIPGSTIATPATVFTPSITDPNSGIRHTLDVFGGMIDPSAATKFSGFQISQYAYWVDPSNNQIEQGFFNPPNLPLFVQGTTPFIGDYLDTAAQTIMPSGSSWIFNTKGKDSVTGATLAPDFHITWTDNRDVVPPPVVNGAEDWTQYVPPNSATSQVSTYSGTGNACPTCATIEPACATVSDDNGSPSAYSGDRNQNVYTSRVTNGLVVRFRENSKPLSKSITRSFSLLVKNTVSPLQASPLGSPSFYRILLGVTSTSQTASCTITGGTANLLPTTPNCYVDVAVSPNTTLTQAVTLTSTSATASLNVLVAQIQSIPFNGANPVFAGLQALAVINADPSNPSVANPDFVTADNSNPDVATPYGNLPIANGEEYNPTVDGPPDPSSGIFTPRIATPAIFTPRILSPANNSPAIETPSVFTPRINTPRIASVQVVNPTIVNAINTPRINTPRINTPRIVAPDIFTPRITDLSDGGPNSLTDYSWTVNNKGNTTASYSTSELMRSAGVSCCPSSCSANPSSCTVAASNPAGPNCSICQLIQHKVFENPTTNRDSNSGNPTCDLNVQQGYITVANIPDPAFGTGATGGSPSDPSNSTLSLSPGEGNRVTLRVVAPPVTQSVSPFKTAATSFSTDTGQTTPPISLTITTGTLPVAVVGQNYTNTALSSVGGFGSTAWTVPVSLTDPVAVEPPPAPNSSEPLPVSPLTLSPSGQISTSVVTATPGTYTVNVQVQDSAVSGTGANTVANPALDVQQLQLEVNQFTISNVNVAISNEIGSTSYMKAGDMAMVSVTVSSTGPATATSVVPTLTVNAVAAGTPSGPTPAVTCGAPAPTSATILGTGTQQFNFICTSATGNGYVTFTANATGQYNNAAANVLATATSVSEPAVTPSGAPPNVIVDTVAPTLTFGTTTSTQSAPGWYNAPVVIPFTSADNLSGVMSAIATSPATSTGLNSGAMTLTTEGQLVIGTMTVTDYARNTAPPFTSSGFNIDETLPTISGVAIPAADAYGWNNTPVTVTFTCNDPNPANGPAGQQSGLASCTAPVTLGNEGANQNVTGTAKDNAANSKQLVMPPINLDFTKPTAAAFVASPSVPATGWYNITTPNVSFSYLAADALSGVATSTPSPIAVLGEGTAVTTPVIVTDKAGNTLTSATPAVMVDRTPPTIAGMASPSANGAGWNNTPVTVTFACNDPNPVSGRAGQQSGLVAGPAGCTAPIPLSSAGTNQSASGTANDVAGNSARTTVTPINIDLIPPIVVLASPVDGHAYINNQPIPANYACSDDLSGVASCLAPVAAGSNFTQTTPGAYTFTVTSSDVAGNASLARNGYSSVYYNFAGFQAPLAGAAGPGTPSAPPTVTVNSGSFAQGTTIPILWTLTSPSNTLNPGPVTDPTTMTSLNAYPYGNSTCSGSIPTANPIQLPTATYTGTSFQSLWNVGTAAPGCYYLLITFNDLSSYATNVVIAAPISTFAGTGVAGFSGDAGIPNSAQLNYPTAVAVDSAGNLYIADFANQRIRVVNTQASPITIMGVQIQPGDIATVAGNGTVGYSGDGGAATSAQLNYPNGVAVDSLGNVYIADTSNNVIREANAATGIITTVAGGGTPCGGATDMVGDSCLATSAQLAHPYLVAVDGGGNLYIGDSFNARVRAVNMQATSTAILGVTILPGYIATVAGTGVPGYSGDGGPATSAQLSDDTNGVAVDSAGNLYIGDAHNCIVREVRAATDFIFTVAGTPSVCSYSGDGGPATGAQLNLPTGVSVDAAGNLYIADWANNRVRVVNNQASSITSFGVTISPGNIANVAGNGIGGYSGDGGPATSAELNLPNLAIDSTGNLYIADYANHRIRKVVP